jgi:type II secretory pathway predicted ATPase ExeA
MDRTGAVTRGIPGRERGSGVPTAQFILPSRAAVLAALVSGLESPSGPVLLTGDTGVGKSWLGRRLRDQMVAPWNWATVDVSPTLSPPGLYRLLLRSLGLAPCDMSDVAAAQVALEDALNEASADGFRWGLIVDEAQNGSEAVLEEIRVLGNALGEPEGFAGILLIGQTSLAARLARRPLSTLGARIATRAHLRPLELEELRLFLGHLVPLRERDVSTIEGVHRAVGGNPRQAFRLFASLDRPNATADREGRALTKTPVVRPDEPPTTTVQPTAAPRTDLSRAVPVRPPLQVSDDVVEVGWDEPLDAQNDVDPDDDTGPSRSSDPETADSAPSEIRFTQSLPAEDATPGEEVIDDRYAALQAWRELEQFQGSRRRGSALEDSPEPGSNALSQRDEADEAVEGESGAEDSPATSAGYPGVRVEEQHGFAPYSQLFSRVRQRRDSP